ncbi:MAG: outer membrane beta-barrel protein [Flavobacteriales bacterium]|nr:outer membrane beta-barrel protein [Flavobacteriales bacterium]
MRNIAVTILSIAVLLAINAPHKASAQAVERGTVIIDPYYGFPLSGKAILDLIFSPIDVSISGVGPTGGRVEYMLADRFGIGVDYIYKQIQGEWSGVDSLSGNTYNYTGTVTRTRIHLRFNFHLLTSTEELDLYVGIGSGTNNRKITLASKDDPRTKLTWNNVTLLPFSARAAFGMRYYFTNNIGINAEIGIGGPLVLVGASIKF